MICYHLFYLCIALLYRATVPQHELDLCFGQHPPLEALAMIHYHLFYLCVALSCTALLHLSTNLTSVLDRAPSPGGARNDLLPLILPVRRPILYRTTIPQHEPDLCFRQGILPLRRS